uniref:Uncharacterized protein n=1 Tax=Octopus bimaculoides TaxID=37653 RepID=A0A0L8I2W6_OCTBM
MISITKAYCNTDRCNTVILAVASKIEYIAAKTTMILRSREETTKAEYCKI